MTASSSPAPQRQSRFALFRNEATTHILLPLFLLCVLIVIGATTLHTISSERQAAQAQAHQAKDELVRAYASHLELSVGAIERSLKAVKYAVGLRGHTRALPMLNELGLTPSGLFFTVRIIDERGIIVASNAGQERADVSAEPYFHYHRTDNQKQTFISHVRPGASRSEWVVYFSRRLNDTSGRFAGVVAVGVDPAYLSSFEHHRLGSAGAIGVVGADGIVRAWRSGGRLTWGQRATLGADSAIAALWDDEKRLVGTQALARVALSAVVGLSVREQMQAFEERRESLLWIAGITSATLSLIVTLLCLWSWQVTRTRARARRAEETYAAASKASMDAFFVLRALRQLDGAIIEFTIEELNDRAEKMLGMARADLLGRPLSTVLPTLRTSGIFQDLVDITLLGGVRECEWQWSDEPGAPRWLHRQVVAVENGVVAIVRDITERVLIEQRIRHIAHHDELTGLVNRTLLRDRLELSIVQAQRRGRCVALVFIDLDGFKQVNDTFGHDGGDELLRVVAARMVAGVRREDTVGRFGGDEFVIVLGDVGPDPAVLLALLEKIRDSVNQPVALAAGSASVGCSGGIAMYPADGASAADLLRHADSAMYRAKQLGKDNVQFYAA